MTSPDIYATHTMRASPSSKMSEESFLRGTYTSHYGSLNQNTELGKRQEHPARRGVYHGYRFAYNYDLAPIKNLEPMFLKDFTHRRR